MSKNESLTTTKGHNHAVNLRKLTGNNPNVDLVNVNAYVRLILVSFHQYVFKILSGNETLMIIKGQYSDENIWQLTSNNLNLDLVKKKGITIPTKIWLRSMHTQNLIKFHQFIHKKLSGNEILTITKGHNHVVNLQKLTINNQNVDIEQKGNSNDNQGP